MSLTHSPRIVTDGLVLYLDSVNTKSYPGSGNTWYDLSGNGNNVQLSSPPTPVYQDNLYFRINNGANFTKTDANISLNQITMIGWYKSITRGGGTYPRFMELHKSGSTVSFSHALAVDDDGSLRDEMKLEVDSGMKNDPRYIVFANVECMKERKDRRWQVPSKSRGGPLAIV